MTNLKFYQWSEGIYKHDEDIIKQGLENGVHFPSDMDIRQKEIPTCGLYLACIAKDAANVKRMIEQGADIDGGDYKRISEAVEKDGKTPFMIAMEEKQFDIAHLLLDQGCDTDWKARGLSALHYSNDAKLTKRLIEKGLDVNLQSMIGNEDNHEERSSGPTPLHSVTDSESLTLLLEAGANPNAHSGTRSVLHEAICGYQQNDKVRVLVRYGADVNEKGSTGLYAIHLAGDAEAVNILVAGGANVNQIEYHGSQALHHVDSLEVGKSLIEHGADVNAIDKYGNTPLHKFVSLYQNDETNGLIKVCLENGANPNALNKNGSTPLHYASDASTATHLLDHGSNPLLKDDNGETAYERATDHCSMYGSDDELLEVLKTAQENAEVKQELQRTLAPQLRTKKKSNVRSM